ncbi:MAG: DUF3080 family protein [Gammaproteobacteria bacterium]|nr:DUF3080 family protein [Gammaproteobacteria bacterium]
MMHTVSARALWLLAILVTSGCAPADPATAMLAEYEQRMARVLNVAVAERPQPELTPWPRTRDRTLAVPPQRTGLGGFLSLHRCDLGSLIGERSSQLGRVMSAPARLHYEHRFLVAAERCLTKLAGDGDRAALREELEAIVEEKRRGLPAWAWNATLGSAALAAAHSLDVMPLTPEAAEEAGRSELAAMHGLAARLPELGRPTLELSDWDEPFETLARSSLPGRLRRSAQALSHHLNGVAEMLEAREASRPVCPQGNITRDADILWNIFRGYYVEQVQPYLVAVDRALREWQTALEALGAAQQVEPPALFGQTVLSPEGGIWPDLDQARERHVAAWRVVLVSCGLLPNGAT